MRKRTKKLLYNIFVCIFLAIIFIWVMSKFIHWGNVEFTDNAQSKQLIVPVNSRIQGFLKEIHFEEYQEVKKGDTLAIIEDQEFVYRQAQAEADYQNAITGKNAMHIVINTTQSNIKVNDASIREAKIRLDNAEKNYNRYKNLLTKEAVTKQQFDDIKTNYDAAKARYDMLNSQKQSATLIKQEQNTRLGQNDAGIKVAKAALDLARLNLSYTIILAPCDGVTGRKNIQAGQLIQPGQTIVDIVDENDKWVIANYKESQISNIKTGQRVDIEFDAIPNVKYKGTVKSISRATGASFSLMPQDNSAGNFVKVEQRIPIRIDFTHENSKADMAKIGAGLNAECTVKY